MCLSADDELSTVRLGRTDLTPWPAEVEKIILSPDTSPSDGAEERRITYPPVPPLRALCARLIAREYAAFSPSLASIDGTVSGKGDNLSTMSIRHDIHRFGGGVRFHPARICPHDPSELGVVGGADVGPAALGWVREAGWSASWPYRVLRLAGQPRRVNQFVDAWHTKRVGTGAQVWGGALALCEELERRSSECSNETSTATSNWMAGKRVVELGSGQGVGSLAAALLGAAAVVSTDLLPDPLQSDGSSVGAAGKCFGGNLLDLIAMNRNLNSRFIPNLRCLGPERPNESNVSENLATLSGPTWAVMPLKWGDIAGTKAVLDVLGGSCDLVSSLIL